MLRYPEYPVRHAAPEDIDFLKRVDIKSFDVGWLEDDWVKVWKIGHTVFTATHNHRPIGFLATHVSTGQSECLRLAVLPEYRQQGVATSLIGMWAVWASDSYHVHKLIADVPESLLTECGEWWIKLGFQPESKLTVPSASHDEPFLRMTWVR